MWSPSADRFIITDVAQNPAIASDLKKKGGWGGGNGLAELAFLTIKPYLNASALEVFPSTS